MSYTLRIFSQNDRRVESNELIEFINDGYFFKEKLEFKVERKADSDYRLTIIYDKEKAPIIISGAMNDEVGLKDISEINFVLNISKKSKIKEVISERMATVKFMYSIEIVREQISDDCWEMLDSTEAMLLEKSDGILFTPENEFFDANLKRIYKL
jgi:hypothetical protein